jgi:hypothetical protein
MNGSGLTRAERRDKKHKPKMAMHGKATKRLAQHLAQRKKG